jgi:hypothetical protein
VSEFMYEETFAPNWPDVERVPYMLIMLRLSESCKNYCKHKIRGLLNSDAKGPQGWSSDREDLAHAYEQFECAYFAPIERLMLEVATLILDGGRNFGSEYWMNYHRAKIKSILQENDMGAMLAGLPQPEREYFDGDLKLLEPLGVF